MTISGIDDLFSDGLKLNKDVSRYDLLSAVARHVKGMRYGPISDQEFNEHGSVLKAIHNTRHGLCLGINSYAAALLYELGEDDLRMAFNDKNPHGWLQVNHGTIENPDWTDYDCTPSKLTNSFARAMKRANQRYADKKKRMESFPYKTIKSAKKTITDLLKKKEETLKTKEDSLETSFPHPADLTELGKGIDKQQPPEEGTRVIEIINGDTLILIHSSETTYKGAAKTPSKEKFKLVPSPTPGIKTKQKKAVTKSKTVTDTKKKETVYTDTTKVDSSLTAVVGSDSLKQEEHPTMSEDSLRIKTQYQEPTKDPFDLIIPLSAVGLGILGTAGYLVYRKRRNGIEEILEQKIIEPIEPPQPVIIIDEHTLYVDEIKKLAEIYLPESVEFKLNRELESSQPRYTLTKDMVVINAHREKLHPLLVTLDYAAHILKDEKIAKTLITQYETLKEVRT